MRQTERIVMSMVPDITAGTGTESDETPFSGGSVGLSQSEGAQERVLSVDGSLFRVPGHLGVGRPSIYTTASGEIYRLTCHMAAMAIITGQAAVRRTGRRRHAVAVTK